MLYLAINNIGDNMATIMYSHRDGVRYFEKCKIVANDEHVSMIMADDDCERYFGIPHANIACLLLGPGTSITQRAAFKLSEMGVLVAFTGGSGAPIFYASQSEYRATEYLQKWYAKWCLPGNRLLMSKIMQRKRCDVIISEWTRLSQLQNSVKIDMEEIKKFVSRYRSSIELASTNEQLMGYEANLVKSKYKLMSQTLNIKFIRDSGASDRLNQLITMGNYLAYGLAGSALWILGIPHGLPVSHGLTRRGALVFDLADVIKDGFVLSAAMMSVALSESDREFRNRLTDEMHARNVLGTLIETIQDICK